MSALLDAARALQPAVLAYRNAMRKTRQMSPELAEMFRDAGLFRMAVPKAYGGLEASPADIALALETLAEADASAAWVAMIAGTTGALAGWLPTEVAAPVFSDPRSVVTGVYAPTGRAIVDGDDMVVSGRWRWNSGGAVSTHLFLGCSLIRNGEPVLGPSGHPETRLCLVPASAATVIETWRTSGMRGTGSNDVCLTDVRVPLSHSVSLTGATPVIAGELFRFPVFGLLAAGIAAVASGNARAGLAHLATRLGEKPLPGGRTAADKATTQATFAEAFARHAGARAFFLSEIASAEDQAGTGSSLTLEQRARLRLAATHLTQESATTVQALHRLAGGEAVFEDDELNQRLTDAEVMTAHIMTAPATLELTGRALLKRSVSSLEI